MTTGLSSSITWCSLEKVTVRLGESIGGKSTIRVPDGAGGVGGRRGGGGPPGAGADKGRKRAVNSWRL